MESFAFSPPWFLRSGLAMTLYTALWNDQHWEPHTLEPEPPYQEAYFTGAGDVPLFGWVAIPEHPKATIVGTYGITGTLENQWFLRILGRKAYAQGFAVVLFDWRAHGKSAELSPVLTSDGLYEGEDFVRIAAQAKALGCPAPLWFTGYSLGGQLALWGVKAAQVMEPLPALGLESGDIGGGAVICPNLDSNRSLTYLVRHPLGRYLEQAIAKGLKKLAWQLHDQHPGHFDPAAIERANSIRGFDHELVIERLGFASVEEYYDASSPLPILPVLNKSTLILYAADDPLFDPSVAADLKAACAGNSAITLALTQYGGHVGYFSSRRCQQQYGDRDPWWAWNRVLDWIRPKIGY
ncbi:YheT family hydrolase [Geitlerinema sp. PCC 7407]|uniref:YheT family hydrolase n=1 Tax=Geitlerinema sp. PCC 7407 TaxID=1173025 RepID=UPI00029F84F3|nr:alpha/beta fold hydrolase [Geitlerinema sp. PCC 7407]AFY67992.1 alpha/beta hydrolase fold protein [Geitlerinema sp. PCC 7407]